MYCKDSTSSITSIVLFIGAYLCWSAVVLLPKYILLVSKMAVKDEVYFLTVLLEKSPKKNVDQPLLWPMEIFGRATYVWNYI